jgi:hypothetical protein
MTIQSTVEFENDRVRVTRVKGSAPGPGSVAGVSRLDRLVVYLRDASIDRKEGARRESQQRHAGDVVWRARSQHEVTLTHHGEHELLIIELK